MKIISDASPLIYLARVNKLGFLDEYGIIIPDQVYAEIKIGKERQKLDYVLIDRLIGKANSSCFCSPPVKLAKNILLMSGSSL